VIPFDETRIKAKKKSSRNNEEVSESYRGKKTTQLSQQMKLKLNEWKQLVDSRAFRSPSLSFSLFRDKETKRCAKLPNSSADSKRDFLVFLACFYLARGTPRRSFRHPDFLTTLPGSLYPLIRSFSSSHSTFRYFYQPVGELRRDAPRRCGFTLFPSLLHLLLFRCI